MRVTLLKALLGFLVILLPCSLFSSNLRITSQPTLVGQVVSSGYTFIEFDIAWDESWRNSTNYDAVWLFVKYKVGTGSWLHAQLSPTAADYSINNDNGNPGTFYPGVNASATNATGVFVYRQNTGAGNINWQGMRLRWNYSANNVSATSLVTVSVQAIEMVNVPQGAFYAGDGISAGSFIQGYNDTDPWNITSENAITTHNGPSNGYYFQTDNYSIDDPSGAVFTIPSDFPKGFREFYCMKYELSQYQYAEFLNKLTYTQQEKRTYVAPNSSIGSLVLGNVFFIPPTYFGQEGYRNGIRIISPGVSTVQPAVYGADMNNNGVPNESDDGMYIACSWLSWADGIAYADWSGLRPMTELEFEKACRGTGLPVAGEYPWGTTVIDEVDSIIYSGMGNETAINSSANCNYRGSSNSFTMGPMRQGTFSTLTSTRQSSGASFYGIMEMGGNLWERCVSTGQSTGRSFVPNHGDGSITSQAAPNVSGWPSTTSSGTGYRGGAWGFSSQRNRISDRNPSSDNSANRNYYFGFRCVRTAL